MSDGTKIEWTDASWNVSRGCSLVSSGCQACYAMGIAHRFSGPGQTYEGLTTDKRKWTGEVRLHPERLPDPLKWRKPRRVFVNSMSDLFHEDVPDEFIAAVFGVMAASPRHTFQVLTKRPERMWEWLVERGLFLDGPAYSVVTAAHHAGVPLKNLAAADRGAWPLPNVWLGCSVEDQATADERIPLLLQCPATVRFISAEPLLGPVNLRGWPRSDPHIDWLIIGAESGPSARHCDPEWIRDLLWQCRGSTTAPFVKQLGRYYDCGVRRMERRDRKGGDPSEWPADLRVREFPS